LNSGADQRVGGGVHRHRLGAGIAPQQGVEVVDQGLRKIVQAGRHPVVQAGSRVRERISCGVPIAPSTTSRCAGGASRQAKRQV
jgi:hypothetical protein